MRKDVAFASQQFEVSERRACKLIGMDRGSYRYEPRPDRNVQLRLALGRVPHDRFLGRFDRSISRSRVSASFSARSARHVE